MKTIDLSIKHISIEEVLDLAQDTQLLVRTPAGKIFVVAEVDPDEDDHDFAQEIAFTRQNKALMTLLRERSQEPGRYTLAQVREKLGLASPE
jgi:hypothetical protein